MSLKIKINENYFNVKKNYLFSDIAKRVKEYSEAHPGAQIVKLGIGDVTLPLSGVVVRAMQNAQPKWATRQLSEVMRPNTDTTF